MTAANLPPLVHADGVNPLWWRLVLPLLALTLLIGAGGAFAYRHLRHDIRHETHRTLTVIAEEKRHQIEELLGRTRHDAKLFFSGQALIAALIVQWLDGGREDAALLARIQNRLSELARSQDWGGLALLDQEGHPLFVIGEADSAEHAAMIQEVLRRPRIEPVDLHRNAQGEAEYGVLAPVGAPDTPPRGLVYLSMSADHRLYPLVESWPVQTQTGDTYLVRRENQQVRFLTPLRHQADAALTLTQPLDSPNLPAARAARGQRGLLEDGLDNRETPVLAYVTAISGTPWLLVAEINQVEADADIRATAWLTALIVGLGLLLVYGAGYLLWRRDIGRREWASQRREQTIEQKRQHTLQLLDAIADGSTDAIFAKDIQGRYLLFNQAAARFTGKTARDALGWDDTVLFPPKQAAQIMANDRQVMDENRTITTQVTTRMVGGERVMLATKGPLHDAEGRIIGIFGISRDITELKRVEDELRQAKEAAEAATAAKSEFLAHMSHEIRTPLNAVLGLAQLLGRERLSANQATLVQRIQAAGQSLLGIINDILDFSKIEAGQLRLETRPFHLETLTAKLDSLLGPTAHAKGLTLRITPPPAPLGPLQGDALRLEQVLINLIGNAIKFTDQGEVSVRIDPLTADAPEVRLRFAVRDTGIGISPAAQARLFQAFTQADAGITRRFGGTGLGLSICKRLVELMGGAIGVESSPGEGSTFWFELTFAPAAVLREEEPVAPVRALPAGPRLPGLRLLAVDDSPMNRDLVERALTLEGARVTLAGDGQQAVQLLRSPTIGFDAVLMDVQMPLMDGRTATRLIRGDLGLRQLPVIALTAGVLAEEQRAIRDAGADEVLAKPLDLEQLVASLLKLIPAPIRQAAAEAAGWAAERGRDREADGGAGRRKELGADQGTIRGTDQGAERDLGQGTDQIADRDLGPGAGLGQDRDTGPRVAAGVGVAGAEFPRIAGIDPARAALAVGNDRAFFLTLLARLLRDSAGVAEDSRLALLAGDRETASRRMHSLKGNAGNLGALDLMQAAAALETAIHQGASDLEADLTDLERQLKDLATASAPWLEGREARGRSRARATTGVQAGAQSGVQAEAQAQGEVKALSMGGQAGARGGIQAQAPAGNQAAVSGEGPAVAGSLPPAAPLDLERLAALRLALQRHNLVALDLFEELEPALAAAWGEAATQTLGEAIADLKFGEALARLDRQAPPAAGRHLE